MALKLVAQEIREVFGNAIITFLRDGEFFFRSVRDVLEQQMKRLSALEEEIVYWLALERESITLSDLQEDIIHPLPKRELQEAVSSLRRRQLIETSTTGITLHPVIMEYLIDRFVEQICNEIRTERLEFFEWYALLKAQAKDYIRESQRRLILQPLLRQLLTTFQKEAIEQRLQSILATMRAKQDNRPNYAAGNVLNMVLQMGCVLREYDFSHLVVRQAYLQGIALSEVNFAYADLETSIFTDTFGSILSVAFSSYNDQLVAGTTTGEIRIWRVRNGIPLQALQGHTDEVRAIVFSPDSKLLASGSDDWTVRLWDVESGQCLNTLLGHTKTTSMVTFSPDGKLLASGSHDQTIRLWDVNSSQCLTILLGHTAWIWSVAFSPDGKLLASGGSDQTIRLWDVSSGQCINILLKHTDWVRSVTFSPDGKLLASGGHDQTIRLWDVDSGQCLEVLSGHTSWIWSVAFSPDG